jgi:outer membrane protein OmpA-like peptidoglycan-associated protein
MTLALDGRSPGRIAIAVVAAALAAVAPPTRGGAAAATTAQAPPAEPRVRELVYKSHDLLFQSRALDGSERVEQGAEQTTVTLAADVLFAFDRADLTPAALDRLDELASDLDELGPRTVTITGHSDGRGDPTYNLDLSKRRAEAVRAALAERVAGGFTFEVAGKGETEPLAPNTNPDGSDNPDGRAQNRRVTIQYPTA